MSTKLTCFDITLKFEEGPYDDHFKLGKALGEICKAHSTFQKEKSLTGFLHWQGRVITKKQYRMSEIVKIGAEEFLHGIHWSPTANVNKGNMDYVTKDFTRCEGPFVVGDLNKPLTWQLKEFYGYGSLMPWQAEIKEILQRREMRMIHLVWDKTGNNGKSLFCEAMEYEGLIEECPPYRMMDDVFQWVYGMPSKPAYVFDLPRGIKKGNLGDFYAGIEVIKNGVAFDKRNYPKKRRIGRPIVVVFTNTLPNFDLMSRDRWVVHVLEDGELSRFDPGGGDGRSGEDGSFLGASL